MSSTTCRKMVLSIISSENSDSSHCFLLRLRPVYFSGPDPFPHFWILDKLWTLFGPLVENATSFTLNVQCLKFILRSLISSLTVKPEIQTLKIFTPERSFIISILSVIASCLFFGANSSWSQSQGRGNRNPRSY